MDIFICGVPLYTAPAEVGFGLLIICTGIPVYIVFVKWQPKDIKTVSSKSAAPI